MKISLLLSILALPVTGGMVGTWLYAKRRERGTIAMRLSKLKPGATDKAQPLTLLKAQAEDVSEAAFHRCLTVPGLEALNRLLLESEVGGSVSGLLQMTFALLLLPPALCFAFAVNSLIGLALGAVLAIVPFVVLKFKAEAVRSRFSEQLPDAIDLMVAILRSGHSVSQAVRAVSQDLPAPCGREFEAVLHRINLGQPLSEALTYSARRFGSYELDLMRRAVSIQSEVGGSLAELLDKTNSTLRQRLKLARQLKVITAQSRLSAQIVGALPFILAIALNFMSPGYLQTLCEDPIGRMLLVGAIVLQALGILVMQRMSTMRV